jgi:hypothetical protein
MSVERLADTITGACASANSLLSSVILILSFAIMNLSFESLPTKLSNIFLFIKTPANKEFDI